MRALVTGGAGFIGSHLVSALLERGLDVRVVDNFSTGRLENLGTVGGVENLQILKADVTDFEAIKPAFDRVDWVFHLAGLADIVPSIVRPLDYHRNNVDGTVSVLEASRLSHVGRFVYAASSSCYGIPDVYPTPETALICPQYPYALTKYLGEELVLHWGRVYGLPVVSLRLFNVFGARSRTGGAYGAVFGVFLAQKLHGRPLTVIGDGSQLRDFVHVTDVVTAFLAAAESDVRQEVFNVGSGTPHTINEIVRIFGAPVVHLPKRPGEPDRTHADIRKIRRMLGWTLTMAFERGVESLLAEIESWRDAPLWTPEAIADATKEWFQHLSAPAQVTH